MRTRELDRVLASARAPEDRILWFGALLAREARTPVEIVGGSAVEIYLTSAAYASQDVDLVGRKDPVARVLRRWGFREVRGRGERTYWHKDNVGLVDLVGPGDRSGLPPSRMETPYGPVLVGRREPLIIGRLSRAVRERSDEFRRQAELLAQGVDLDWGYLDTMARFEGVPRQLARLRNHVPRRPGSLERRTRG